MPRKSSGKGELKALKKKYSQDFVEPKKPRKGTDSPAEIPYHCSVAGGLFIVDFFKKHKQLKNDRIYVLTHFHTDHYQGLTKAWSEKKILMTPMTRDLVVMELEVDPSLIITIDYGQKIEFIGECDFLWIVTCYPANHCPGAAMFLFECGNPTIPNTFHTGDFRYSPEMELPDPKNVQILHVDNTYFIDGHFNFPPLKTVLKNIVTELKAILTENDVVLVGAYRMGKDQIITSIYNEFKEPFFFSRCDSKYEERAKIVGFAHTLNTSSTPSRFHILPVHMLSTSIASSYLENIKGKVYMIKGSGWNMDKKRDVMNLTDRIILHYYPYSEHSGYLELQEFMKLYSASKIVKTVPEKNQKICNIQNFLNQ